AVLWSIATAYSVLLSILAWRSYYVARAANVPLLTMALLGLMLLQCGKPNWRSLLVQGSVFIGILPVIATIGTNCNFLGHASSNMCAWFILSALGAIAYARRTVAPRAVASIAIAFSVFILYDFVDQYVFNRYDCDPLAEQTAAPATPRLLKGVEIEP